MVYIVRLCRLSLASFFVVLTLLACSSSMVQPTAEEQAAEKALLCYQALFSGHYADFVAERADVDQMPPSFLQQLELACKQYASQLNRDHDGVNSVSVSRVQSDSTLRVMQVFLMLCFGDNTQEEIVVPMTERNGDWYLK